MSDDSNEPIDWEAENQDEGSFHSSDYEYESFHESPMLPTQVPCSKDEARDLLCYIFRGLFINDRNWIRFVRDLLLRYPSLAGEKLPCRDMENYVLAYLLGLERRGLELSHVQQVYELFPEAIQYQDDMNMLPLHHACNNSFLSTEIIAFLVNKFPAALSMPAAHKQYLPIHYLIKSIDREDVGLLSVRILVEAYPASLCAQTEQKDDDDDDDDDEKEEEKEDEEGGDKFDDENNLGTPLELALKNPYLNGPIILYLLQRLPSSHGIEELRMYSHVDMQREQNVQLEHNMFLDESVAAIIADKLLPKIKSLDFSMDRFTPRGQMTMMRSLLVNPPLASLKELGLWHLPEALPHVASTLKNILRSNQQLKRFNLDIPSDHDMERRSYRSFLEAVFVGLQRHASLQLLALWGFKYLRVNDVAALLTCGAPLETLALCASSFDSDDDLNWSASDRALLESPVEDVTIEDCDIPQETFARFLSLLKLCPELHSLVLDEWDYSPISFKSNKESVREATEALVYIVKNYDLNSLRLSPFAARHYLDLVHFFKALQSNRTLESLDLTPGWIEERPKFLEDDKNVGHLVETLRHHNTTLTEVQPGNEDIDYLTDLNKCGRDEARNPNTSIPRFIEILTDFLADNANDNDNVDNDDDRDEWTKQSLIYDLLREGPSIWCNSYFDPTASAERLTGRKRKHSG